MPRRRRHASILGALAAGILLLAGCTTPGEPEVAPVTPAAPLGPAKPAAPITPAHAAKPPPPPVVELKPATIMGSEESSTMFDNFTAYIKAVDGAAAGDRNAWSTPLTLKAGARRLTIAFIRGVFTAQTDVQIDARTEASYQLKFSTDAHLFGKNTYCEFWIEDTATGEKVLAPTRVPLSKLEQVK